MEEKCHQDTRKPTGGRCITESETPVFSFVLPVYNEAQNLEPLSRRLIAVGETLGEPFEIIWVDDGSTDGSGNRLMQLAAGDARIRPVLFSRNFGHMAALTAGFDAARATGAVICLDSDGQHPPELIPDMIARWRSGADIVQTVREPSADENAIKRLTSRGFYWVINTLADIDLPAGSADFRLMDRQVIQALGRLPECMRFTRGLVVWVGFRTDYISYKAQTRLAGNTKYSLIKMISFAVTGITSFSVRPLRISIFMGISLLAATVVYAAYVLWCFCFGAGLAPGWPSLILLIMALGGMQLFTIGIMSEYLARVYIEQKHRPVYIVRQPRDSEPDPPADAR